MGWLFSKRIGLDVTDGTQGRVSIPPIFGGAMNAAGALYPDSGYQSYSTNGYGRNELVYACIFERAESLPQSRLRVYADGPDIGGRALEDHRLRRLIARPNPTMTEYQFFELSVTYLDLSGNCFWLIQRGRDGLPTELWPLRPDLVRIYPTTNPRVYSYGYVIDPTGNVSASSEIVPIPDGDIIHVKYPNPLDPYFGQPPLRAAARSVAMDNAATDFVDTLLRNSAVPGAVVTTIEAVDQDLTDRLRARWRATFGGSGRGDVAFLQQGMDVKALGMNLRDLEFPDLRAETESRICSTFKVPPILVGAKVGLDRSTFANYREARVSLWEESIMPLQRRFSDAVEAQLLPEFMGTGRARVRLAWDNSEVLALREGERDRWERTTNALARGGITLNDFRRSVGLDTVGAGDVFLVPAGVTVASADDLIPTTAPEPTTADPSPAIEAASSTRALRSIESKNRTDPGEPMRDRLFAEVEWKSAGDPGSGILEGYASVFGNVDQGGDVVVRGAFKKTLNDWSKSKQPLPLIADHVLSTDGVVGSVISAREDEHGLLVRASFARDEKSQALRQKMIDGHIKGMSFTYETVKSHAGVRDGKSVRFLTELRLWEATVTPFPMNPEAVATAKALEDFETVVADEDFVAAFRAAAAIPSAAAAKAALAVLIREHSPTPSAVEAVEPDTDDEAVATPQEPADTSDAAAYAAALISRPSEPRDGALDPVQLLTANALVRQDADLDALEERIRSELGRNNP